VSGVVSSSGDMARTARGEASRSGVPPPASPSARLEHEAQTFGFRDRRLAPSAMGSPQQMQIKDLMSCPPAAVIVCPPSAEYTPALLKSIPGEQPHVVLTSSFPRLPHSCVTPVATPYNHTAAKKSISIDLRLTTLGGSCPALLPAPGVNDCGMGTGARLHCPL
jgi:hypothetical protein